MGIGNRTSPALAGTPTAAVPLATVGPAPPVLDPGGNMAAATASAAQLRARLSGSGRASTILGTPAPTTAPPSFSLSPRPGSWRPY